MQGTEYVATVDQSVAGRSVSCLEFHRQCPATVNEALLNFPQKFTQMYSINL